MKNNNCTIRLTISFEVAKINIKTLCNKIIEEFYTREDFRIEELIIEPEGIFIEFLTDWDLEKFIYFGREGKRLNNLLDILRDVLNQIEVHDDEFCWGKALDINIIYLDFGIDIYKNIKGLFIMAETIVRLSDRDRTSSWTKKFL